MTIVVWILKLMAGFAAGLAGVVSARCIARRIKLVSKPNPIVLFSKKPVPLLGGAGVFVPYGILVIFLTGFKFWSIVLAAGVWLLVILGTIDDIKPLSWWQKLLLEAVLISGYLPLMFVILAIPVKLSHLIPGILFVLVLTNGFNLIDVSDGLAGSVGLVMTLGLVPGFVFFSQRPEMAAACLVLAGALAAFLIFNSPKATIYLGDGGSLPLGLIIGILLVSWLFTVRSPQGLNGINIRSLVVFISLPSLTFFEILLLSFHRIRKRISVFRGSPDHFALRLKKNGWGSWKVLMVSSGVSVILACSMALMVTPMIVLWIYSAVIIGFYCLSFRWLSRIEV